MSIVEVSVLDEGLSTAIDIVNRFMKSVDGIIDPIQVFVPFKLNIDSFPALGTGQTRIVLKPSERLLELVAAAGAVDINVCIIKKS